MFEIRYRDAMGRIGVMEVRGKKLKTPAILPVFNPKVQTVKPEELMEMGFEGVIANSYQIYRDDGLKIQALKKGLHKFLDFDGVIMTDSGSYQLYSYGNVEVGAKEIVEFQRDIGSDVGVILDIPTPPNVGRKRAERDLEETIKRAKESLKSSGNMLLSGTVQGSTFMDLRERSAKEMSKLNFDLYPIGGVVPLMESYRFSDLVEVITHSKKFLPLNKPVHLFGCGHPMVFSLAVALGCDLFDSAAYNLYAKNGRYITSSGTLRLERMGELPCSCEVCTEHSPREVLTSDERERLLAMHNLYAMLEEMKTVKQSIYEGSLWELVERRARNHPAMLNALRHVHTEEFVDFDPLTKRSAFFYFGPESTKRPEVLRHLDRLNEIEAAPNLVLLPDGRKPYSRTYGTYSNREYHVCVASQVFGVIPLEVEEIYPLNQHEAPGTFGRAGLEFMRSKIRGYAERFKNVYVHKALDFLNIEGEFFDDVHRFGAGDIEWKLIAMADYQFGRGAGRVLFKGTRAEYARTGRIRKVYLGDMLLATIRASDGFIILSLDGAGRLLKLKSPRNRVIIEDEEVCQLARRGRSIFAKFVHECDPEIKPYQEVVVVNNRDELLATGKAILNSREMQEFDRGVAVKVRRGTSARNQGKL